MKEIEYINSFSFIFSPRPGTPAADLDGFCEGKAKERLTIFQKIADDIKMKYRKSLFNKKISVLFENRIHARNEFFGRDKFANSVIVKTNENLTGKIKEVKVIDVNRNTLFGEIIDCSNKKDFAA